MRLNIETKELPDRVKYIAGSSDAAALLTAVRALPPFDDSVIEFLNQISKVLMKDGRSKTYSDVITFAFWIRKGSLLKLKEKFARKNEVRLGKGIVFHIAPSNVPVNFAYSLVAGLLTGNANIVRVPSRSFPQIDIIADAINHVLEEYSLMKQYVFCVRYDRNKDINDMFSSIADMRVIWGGDQTIEELRRSPLPPRSGEVTFADRYSLAVIHSNSYLAIRDKERVAEDFYNDTFFSDQNACTSPRVIIWTGDKIEMAKKEFWDAEHDLVEKKYVFQAIQGINKLTQSYMIANAEEGVKIEKHTDNLIIRVKVPEITEYLMDYRDNSGYFYEYDCKNALDIGPLVNDKRCQTIAYIGDKDLLLPLIEKGVRGIDRIVPMGKTMDFDLIWDGYNLPALLTRTIVMV